MGAEITVFWFRRDLRLADNAGLFYALSENEENKNVLPLFIFDSEILAELPKDDARVSFIHQSLMEIKSELQKIGSDILIRQGSPIEVFRQLETEYKLKGIYANHDYESSAVARDQKIQKWADQKQIIFKTYKDQCIFEKNEVVAESGKSYTVYTPYKKKWLSLLKDTHLKPYPTKKHLNQLKSVSISESIKYPTLADLGFKKTSIEFPPTTLNLNLLKKYAESRNFPAQDSTSRLGLHLRFGTVSIRALAQQAQKISEVWLSELIWRDFFMQILWHYPHVEKASFRPQYEKVAWRKNKAEFEKWCAGQTGYPLVDAGMRELNQTGFMHNRVRMVVASFLTKHLLMHWLQGERYFAEKLLDYDLSANNGNWQWSAGTGCDAAPYFRVFNPSTQLEKFDPDLDYVKKWVPEFGTDKYNQPMVEHVFARDRALAAFKLALKGSQNE